MPKLFEAIPEFTEVKDTWTHHETEPSHGNRGDSHLLAARCVDARVVQGSTGRRHFTSIRVLPPAAASITFDEEIHEEKEAMPEETFEAEAIPTLEELRLPLLGAQGDDAECERMIRCLS